MGIPRIGFTASAGARLAVVAAAFLMVACADKAQDPPGPAPTWTGQIGVSGGALATCQMCHFPGTSDLTTLDLSGPGGPGPTDQYTALVGLGQPPLFSTERPSLLIVQPGNSAGSYLYMKMIGDPRIWGRTMPPPPPYGTGMLPGDQTELVKQWIDGGAPN